MLSLPADFHASLATADDETLALAFLLATHPLYTFQPRMDRPNDFDEQAGFVGDKKSKFAICLGGTGSGKTAAAALKTARYVLETPPPVEQCPFWIIGEYFDQICQVAWVEKLSKFIPESEILDVHWWQTKRRWPRSVTLRHPLHRDRPGWILEFKSYEQGMGSMKAVSIGGYWFNEEVPYELVFEVQGRCRDYDSPGWADFTPIECKSPQWIDAYEQPPEGWRFYHLNSMMNDALAEGWAERFLASVPEDMRELRQIGRFTTLKGTVYKEFRKAIHVVEPFRIPRDWRKLRGIDFGFNNPFCCLWVAVDHDGRYHVYDEHYESQKLNGHHVEQINKREWDPSQPWFGPTYTDHDAQQRAELSSMGINCTPANKSINQGIELLRSLMITKGDGRPQFFVFSKCVNLIREMIGYKWPEGTDARNPKDVPLDVNNHALDALRYAIFSDRVKTLDLAPTGERITGDAKRHGVLLSRRRGG